MDSPCRVLVIDDDEALGMTMCAALETVGYAAAFNPNAPEALKEIETATPDLVITDILMPEADGIEVIRRLRGKTKIIAMSAGERIGADVYLGMAKSLGAAATLRQPFTLDELLVLVEKVVRA